MAFKAKSTLLATALGLAVAAPAFAEPVAYNIDPSHSQIVFNYDHQGWTSNFGFFGAFGGEIMFDAENPAASSVSVTLPLSEMDTGFEARTQHVLSADFFDAANNPDVTFVSTGIEVTGENTALITGDLTMAGTTAPVVLDATMNKTGTNMRSGAPQIGLTATTTVLRSDFGVDQFVPFISDEVEVQIVIEAVAG